MTERVPADRIEAIVGAARQLGRLIGRLIGPEGDGDLFILHSSRCRAVRGDLRECHYSLMLDRYGVPTAWWEGMRDRPVRLGIMPGVGLVPEGEVMLDLLVVRVDMNDQHAYPRRGQTPTPPEETP